MNIIGEIPFNLWKQNPLKHRTQIYLCREMALMKNIILSKELLYGMLRIMFSAEICGIITVDHCRVNRVNIVYNGNRTRLPAT